MLSKSSETYDIFDRYISIPVTSTTFAIVGDNLSRVLTFRISRYVDGVDLSSKEIHICYKTSSNSTGSSKTSNLRYSSSILKFDWAVPSEITTTSGKIEFYVEFRTVDENNRKIYVLKTMPITKDVEPSFSISNNALAADYTSEKSFIEANTSHVTRTDLVDTELAIKVIDRDIVINTNKVIAVCKDNMSQMLSFRIKRKVDGIDRADKTFCIKFINANGESDRVLASNITIYEDEITFGWALDSKVTKYPGSVQFAIGILGYLSDGSLYAWGTKPTSFIIEGGLEVDTSIIPPSSSWFDSWTLEADNILQQAARYTNQSKDYFNYISIIKKDIQELLKTVEEQVELAKTYASKANDAVYEISGLYVVREDVDENESTTFRAVRYYRPNDTLYMISKLNTVNSPYDQRIEEKYSSDGKTLTSTSTYPIIRDINGIVIGRFGSHNELQYHGLI